ncbi:hypothetical protein diail_463 [Diaporthe ilicicola]|nr:hypothetical protein diail_463 [Diaporthe ilicicola]
MLLINWLSKSILGQAVTSLMDTSRAIPFNDLYHQGSHTGHRHPRDLRTWDLHARDDNVSATCTNPDKRREWRSLSTTEQEEYISAVKCLATKPSRLNLTTTLYDDFSYVHNELNNKINFVASFLPWHRWFVHIYEQALHDDCGLSFPMPYWDWSLDAGHLQDSPLLSGSPATGFGGSGPGGSASASPSRPNPLTSCVPDGAFANLTVAYYAGAVRPHCLNRAFSDGLADDPQKTASMSAYYRYYTPSSLASMTASNNGFVPFWRALEDGPHRAVHNALGGDMVPGTSPNDPLFMMHHAQVDRLWWLWQRQDWAARSADFGGNREQVVSGSEAADDATLADPLAFLGVGADVTVETVMTTDNSLLCYAYE